MGEQGGHNYLKPGLVKDLVQLVNGTFIDANTAYGGLRCTAKDHMKVAHDHGFAAIAPIDILDAEGESILHRTGVKSVILSMLFSLIERIGHRFRRRVPVMLNEGVKQKLYESQAGSFAAPECASGWSSGNLALIFCYFGIKAKVDGK